MSDRYWNSERKEYPSGKQITIDSGELKFLLVDVWTEGASEAFANERGHNLDEMEKYISEIVNKLENVNEH